MLIFAEAILFNTLIAMGEFREAIKECSNLIDLKIDLKNDILAHFARSKAYQGLAINDLAIKDFKTA